MISSLILLVIAAVVVITSFKRVPEIGVFISLVIIGVMTWLRGDGLTGLGLAAPEDWGRTFMWSFLFGIAIQFFSTLIIEPFSDKVTKSSTDHSIFETLRGNIKYFLIILVSVWVLVALIEEIIFRGYIMGEIATLIGTSKPALAINVILSSILFGLAHWYQGKSGALSTGIVGALLGIMFIASGFNLWLPILTHGFIDTVGLFLIYLNVDKVLKERAKIFG